MDANVSPLDNPPWAALTGAQRDLAQGGPLAVRYLPEIAPFGAVAERTVACFDALARLISPAGRVALQTPDLLVPPAPFVVERQARLFQMVLDRPVPAEPDGEPGYVVLGGDDVPDMTDLTGRTRPGPFGRRTIELGRYIGIRDEGVLAAMAGERMRFDRYVEISGVCTDPAFRGRGLATRLMLHLARRIQGQELVPILHVYESNVSAIAVYKPMGFVARRSFFMTVIRADGSIGS